MTVPNTPIVPDEEPRDWQAELTEASGPALPEEPPEVVAQRAEMRRQAELRDRADADRQALAAQTELGHSIAEDVGREIGLKSARHAVSDRPSGNLDLSDRPHFAVSREGEPDRCGQDGEVWPCAPWRNVIGPRVAVESLGVAEMPVPAADERLAAAARLLGLDAAELDTMLQRHDDAGR